MLISALLDDRQFLHARKQGAVETTILYSRAVTATDIFGSGDVQPRRTTRQLSVKYTSTVGTRGESNAGRTVTTMGAKANNNVSIARNGNDWVTEVEGVYQPANQRQRLALYSQ